MAAKKEAAKEVKAMLRKTMLLLVLALGFLAPALALGEKEASLDRYAGGSMFEGAEVLYYGGGCYVYRCPGGYYVYRYAGGYFVY